MITLATIDVELPVLRPVFDTACADGMEREHALQVTRLALALFDLLQPLHKCDEGQRPLLHVAALLHDIGLLDGPDRHHKRSFRRILTAELPFTEPEQLQIALIARYHRGADPQDTHPGFRDLRPAQRKTVTRLASLLRIADALDRTHRRVVTAIDADVTREKVLLRCETRVPAEQEHVVALEKGKLLTEVFHRTLEITWQIPEFAASQP